MLSRTGPNKKTRCVQENKTPPRGSRLCALPTALASKVISYCSLRDHFAVSAASRRLCTVSQLASSAPHAIIIKRADCLWFEGLPVSLTRLQTQRLELCHVGAKHLRGIARMTALRELTLGHTRRNLARGLDSLSALTHLHTLTTRGGCYSLGRFPLGTRASLVHLDLSVCNIGDLTLLEGAQKLQRLRVVCPDPRFRHLDRDHDLIMGRPLASWPALTALDIRDLCLRYETWKAAASHLSQLRDLQVHSIGPAPTGSGNSGDTVEPLGFARLESYTAYKCDGVEYLVGLSTLRKLHIAGYNLWESVHECDLSDPTCTSWQSICQFPPGQCTSLRFDRATIGARLLDPTGALSGLTSLTVSCLRSAGYLPLLPQLAYLHASGEYITDMECDLTALPDRCPGLTELYLPLQCVAIATLTRLRHLLLVVAPKPLLVRLRELFPGPLPPILRTR
jgi:hypothetical protein